MKRVCWLLGLMLIFLSCTTTVSGKDDILLLLPALLAGGGPGKNQGIRFIPGTSTVQDSQLVPVSGGELRFTQGPLTGVVITIPPNARQNSHDLHGFLQ